MDDKIFLIEVNGKKFITYGEHQGEAEARWSEELAHLYEFEDYTVTQIELTAEIINDNEIEYF